MGQRNYVRYDLLALDSVDVTTMALSQDYRNAVFTIVASGSADCTLKFYSSGMVDRPDLSAAASASNEYGSALVVDLEDASNIEGDTGVVYAGSSDGVHKYEINQNGNRWLGVKMTARSAGSVQVYLDLYNNQ